VNCGCKSLAEKQVVGLPEGLKPRFFAGLTSNELNSIVSAATHRHFSKSSVVIHQDDPAERLFLLSTGQGRQFVISRDGRKIILHWLTAGQFFGGVTILSHPYEYLASTEVLADSCALVWDRKTIRELISQFPGLLDNGFSIAVTENIAWLVATRVSLSSDDATARIAQMLLSLASGIGKPGPGGIEIHVGNEDLAAEANVTPFTVSRALAAWQREGVLTKGRGKVLLRKPELLVTK